MNNLLTSPLFNFGVITFISFWMFLLYPFNLLYVHLLTKAYLREDNDNLVVNLIEETEIFYRQVCRFTIKTYQKAMSFIPQHPQGTPSTSTVSEPEVQGNNESHAKPKENAVPSEPDATDTQSVPPSSPVNSTTVEEERVETVSTASSVPVHPPALQVSEEVLQQDSTIQTTPTPGAPKATAT